jgi:predicted  nucleic acid-binding Zn-ribbon protein
MLSLTRLFFHHWHRFYAATLDVDSGLCLTGPDEADSAAVLDGLQLVLFGDPARARFHSTRYGFTHDLDSYARGRLTEDKWQRPGNTVSYVIAEFTNTANSAKSTFGLCIETGPRLAPEITWFILNEGFNPTTFVTKGRPLPRIELKPLLRNWRGARFFEKSLDYQTEVLNLLGGLDESFFDLFQRALHYQPVRRVEDFTSSWFFDEQPIDLSLLRRMRDRLTQLHIDHDRAEKQQAALQPITKGQAELSRLSQLRDGQTVLIALLRSHAAQRRVAATETQIAALQTQLTALQTQITSRQATVADLDRQSRDAERVEFENGLSHRKTVLQWQSRYATFAADSTRQRWLGLQKQFQTESGFLRQIDGLTPEEDTARRELLSVLDSATAPDKAPLGDPPPPALAAILSTVIPTLSVARDRLSGERTRLADQLSAAQAQLATLNKQIASLSQDAPPIPTYVSRMQDLLSPVIGKKPALVYEYIEVSDARWQNAVEAMLGPARFHAIVSATWFNAARANINKQRVALDLRDADVHDPTQHYNRPAQPGSLAEKVTTIYPDLRAYLDTLLGDILCAETVEEAQHYPRAITPDCVYISGRHAHTFDYFDYQPVVLGKTAYKVFTETRQKQVANLQSQVMALQAKVTDLEARIANSQLHVTNLGHIQGLATLRESLSPALDERPSRTEAAGYEAELRGLDTAPLAELQNKAATLRANLSKETQARDDLLRQQVGLEHDLEGRKADLVTARAAFAEAKSGADSTRQQFSAVAAAADEALPPHLKPTDLNDEIKIVEQKEKDFDKKVRDERLRLMEALAALNAVYQLAPWPGDPNDGRYGEALTRLTTAELPRLERDIATAEQEIEEELRDHILRPLRDRLVSALRTLDQINDTLAELDSLYRLQAEPMPDLKDYYTLILNSNASANPAGLNQFFELLTTQTDPRLADYRRYLQFALVSRTTDGQLVRFTTADGDTQLAYYLIIAASFAQLYRLRKYGDTLAGRPCIRLLPFSNIFSRMDSALIAPVLDLYKRLGFQLTVGVSLERSDILVSGLPTTIVLTPVKDTLLPEPYRNYAALPSNEGAQT